MVKRLLRAQPDSVANHVTARLISINCFWSLVDNYEWQKHTCLRLQPSVFSIVGWANSITGWKLSVSLRVCVCVLTITGSLVSIFLISHGLCWTVFGQVEAHAMQFFINWTLPNHWNMTVASSRLWAISWTCVHWQRSMVDYNYFTKLKMMQSSGWTL